MHSKNGLLVCFNSFYHWFINETVLFWFGDKFSFILKNIQGYCLKNDLREKRETRAIKGKGLSITLVTDIPQGFFSYLLSFKHSFLQLRPFYCCSNPETTPSLLWTDLRGQGEADSFFNRKKTTLRHEDSILLITTLKSIKQTNKTLVHCFTVSEFWAK